MIGQTISHYRIIEKLGGGGMGIVYKAEDLTLKRTVALKFLPPEMTRDPDAKTRFVAEARAASAIDHPNICTIHEIGDAPDGQMFIAMSYYGGESLKQRIGQGPVGVAEAVRVAAEAAQGLAKAHATGIIHRDIKPGNIMLTDDGQVKIVDFGLAKLAGQSRMTRTGTTMGTIAYMSPEQAKGESVDARADVWALGVVLHEMLVGELPFKGDHEQALVYNILNTEPGRVTEARRDVPVELERIVERAMEKRPEGRYATMALLAKELQELSRRIASGELRRRRLPFHLRRRQARVLGVAAVALVAVLAAAAVLVWRLEAGKTAPVSIAVLPFKNIGGDASDDFLAEAITEGLFTELLKIGRLRVASVGSAQKPDAAGTSLPDLARELRVSWMVDGKVLRDKTTDRVQITVQLYDTGKDEAVWAEKYTRSFSDIFQVQEEITRTIAAKINVEVGTTEVAAPAPVLSADANEAYLKGRFHAAKLTAESIALSIDYFRKAIELAPAYAPAYAGLAHSYALQLATVAAVPPRESAEKATLAAQQALRIDKSLAEPHRVLGEIHRDYDWDFAAADAEMEIARQAKADDPATLAELARLRRLEGEYGAALELAQQAQQLDTLDRGTATLVALIYASLDQLPRSIDELQRVLDFDPSFVPALEALGTVQVLLGAWNDAIAAYEKAVALSPAGPVLKARLAYAYARGGRRADAQKARSEMEALAQSAYVPAPAFALVAAGLGETGTALDWLEKAVEERSAMIPEIPLTPELDTLRGEPRLAAILGKVWSPSR